MTDEKLHDQQAEDAIFDRLDATAYFTHDEARGLSRAILADLKEQGWRRG